MPAGSVLKHLKDSVTSSRASLVQFNRFVELDRRCIVFIGFRFEFGRSPVMERIDCNMDGVQYVVFFFFVCFFFAVFFLYLWNLRRDRPGDRQCPFAPRQRRRKTSPVAETEPGQQLGLLLSLNGSAVCWILYF